MLRRGSTSYHLATTREGFIGHCVMEKNRICLGVHAYLRTPDGENMRKSNNWPKMFIQNPCQVQLTCTCLEYASRLFLIADRRLSLSIKFALSYIVLPAFVGCASFKDKHCLAAHFHLRFMWSFSPNTSTSDGFAMCPYRECLALDTAAKPFHLFPNA